LTSNALIEKIKTLALKLGIDPSFSIQCVPAAFKLASHVESDDVVLWSEIYGGLAWTAMGKQLKKNSSKSSRVFCVIPDYVFDGIGLWHELDSAASLIGGRIIPVRLLKEVSSGFQQHYPPLITSILERFFPAPPTVPVDGTAAILEIPISSNHDGFNHRPDFSGSDFSRLWQEESTNRIILDSQVNLQLRFLGAAAASFAGLIPLILLNRDEAASAASLIRSYSVPESFKTKYKILITIEGDWIAADIFKIITDLNILSPLSGTDYLAALNWAEKSGESTLVIDPGDKSYPARSLHKQSWDTEKILILKEAKNGHTGSILFIVPGIMAKEAGKASDRLKKDDYSVAVMALRFIRPTENQRIRDIAAKYDLVIVADLSSETGGFKAELGLSLMSLEEIHIAVTQVKMNGKELAEYASALHREDRFHRTVDDVRKDRWR